MQYTTQQEKLAYLQEVILQILHEHPNGLSEYELIKILQDNAAEVFHEDALKSNLSMYQCHFILFHCLYSLQERLRVKQQEIDIHCLKIILQEYTPSDTTLPAAHDPLRAYYLDLSQLTQTSEDDVNVMLNSFWKRFICHDQRAYALEILSLKEPVSFEEIRKQYKRLVMEHHPDRGGDKTKLQAINEAMSLLQNS